MALVTQDVVNDTVKLDYSLYIKLTINLLSAVTASVNMSLPTCHSYRIQTISTCSNEAMLNLKKNHKYFLFFLIIISL